MINIFRSYWKTWQDISHFQHDCCGIGSVHFPACQVLNFYSTDSFIRAILSSNIALFFWRAWKTNCVPTMNVHTHILKSHTGSVIDAGTSAVVVAPSNRVVCWRVRRAALWAGSDLWHGSTFFTASCIYFLSTECRGKRLLLLTSCTSCQKAYRLSPFLLSMPSVIHLLILYQLGWHLPQSSWTFSPSYCPHDVSARVSMQHKTRFKHIFPRPAPYYRCLANDFSLREG